MNESIKIDPEFRDLLPPLTTEEYSSLKKLCNKQGTLDSLKTWKGFLIDGHNRYQISEECDLNYEIYDMTDDFDNKAQVMQWIIDNQGARRNLTLSQKIQAQAKVHAELEREAKENSNLNLKQNADVVNLPTRNTGRVSEQMASKVGVSEKTYRDAKYVVEHGTEDQIKRMDKGGKGNGVSKIAKEIKDKNKPEITEKKCSKCGKVLSIDNFYFNKSKQVYESECKNAEMKGNLLRRKKN